MKHVVTLGELRHVECEFPITSSYEGSEYKVIYLRLRDGEVMWIVKQEVAGYGVHLTEHSCLIDAIMFYNEI